MHDRTNHNKFAAQFAERLAAQDFVETRVTELAAFEKKAKGETPSRKPKRTPSPVRTAPAASVAQQEQPAMNNFSLFQPAASTSAYLKMGIMGKQGAGKSMTAGLLAIGLAKHLKSLGIDYASKPVAYFDTEKGSDWLIPIFAKEGIPLVVAKKRAFADLVAAVKWAEENASALIIDSITHPWRELQESYLRKKQRSFLQIDDWAVLKGPNGWQQFTDLYINSKLHIIMAGRAGDETEQYTDDNGKRQFEKVGVKMKTETDTGFEPDLLVLMERDMDLRSKHVAHVARVVKDRSMLLDSKDFTFASYDVAGNGLPIEVLVKQTFSAFLPHINCLNLGGAHIGVNLTGDSTHIIKTEKRDWAPVQRRIVLDEIKDVLAMHVPGQTTADKQRRIVLLKTHFSAGWVEIEETFDLLTLRAGYDSLHQDLTGKPSRYAAAMEAEKVPLELNDDIPAHSKSSTALKQDATAAVLGDGLPEFAAAAG